MARSAAGFDDVQFAVVIHVTQCDRGWTIRHGQGGTSSRISASRICQHDAEVVAAGICRDEIQLAVVVQIAHRNPLRISADIHWRQTDKPETGLLYQDGGSAVGTVRGNDVDPAITVHIGQRGIKGCAADKGGRRRGEPRAGIAQQYADVVADPVCRDDVEPAVAVDIGKRDRLRSGPHRKWRPLRDKAARAVAEQYGESSSVRVRGDDIKVAVTIDVAERDGLAVGSAHGDRPQQ